MTSLVAGLVTSIREVEEEGIATPLMKFGTVSMVVAAEGVGW